MPCSGARLRAGPGIADLHVQRPAPVDQRAQLDAVVGAEVAVLDAVGDQLGDDELDLAGTPRPQRQRLDGAAREDDARGVRRQQMRRLVVGHVPACNDGRRRTWRYSRDWSTTVHGAMSRRDQISMSDDEVLAFLDEERTVVCATNGREGART